MTPTTRVYTFSRLTIKSIALLVSNLSVFPADLPTYFPQKILQLSYNELLRGQPLTWEKEHPVHCLDSLRQYVMCNADDTPLYTWGRNITGDGQARQCKDWGVLREWAKEHTACYKQTAEPLTFRQRFGRCNDGGDGLEDLAPYASVQGG